MGRDRSGNARVIFVRLDQGDSPLDGLIRVLTVAGILFHHRLPGDSTDPHLVHDLRHNFLEIVHVKHRRHTGEQQLADGISRGKPDHLRVHGLILHRKQEHPQAVLAVVPETAERDHAEVAVGVHKTRNHDGALRIDLLEGLASF